MPNVARPMAYTAVQKAVGDRIVWVRECLGLSQADLARRIDVDRSTLSKIESGDRAASIFIVLAIAEQCRVSTDFLLRGVLIGRTEEALALDLAARHPELRPSRSAKPDGGGFRPPRRWSRPGR